jgi:hypothetical protein
MILGAPGARAIHLGIFSYLCLGATLAEAQSAVNAQCSAQELGRTELSVNGGRLYIEPVVLSRSGSQILLAGTPNYIVFSPQDAATPIRFYSDTIFGALIGPNGSLRLVAPPIPGKKMLGIRAAVRSDGKWEIVFAEILAGTDFAQPEVVVGLWHATLTDTAWSGIEQLPLPDEGPLRVLTASALVQQGDTLAWAIELKTRDGGAAAVFERRGGTWSYTLLHFAQLGAIQLTYVDRLGIVLLAAHPDQALSRDNGSLFMYAKDSAWRGLRRVVRGDDGSVITPQIEPTPTGYVLSWSILPFVSKLGNATRAIIGNIQRSDAPFLTIDSSTTHFVPVVLIGGMVFWVTEHVDNATHSRELRLITAVLGVPKVVARVPAPYDGYFGAVATDQSTVLVAGPALHRSDRFPTLTTLLIRFRAQCTKR